MIITGFYLLQISTPLDTLPPHFFLPCALKPDSSSQNPLGPDPEVFENELENGVWGTPSEHLKKWYADDILISPPVLALLEKLNKSPASDWRLFSDKGLITQDEFVLDRVRFASWIQVVSVACPGPSLPQIGNVFLVGLSKFYLIDPGALDDLGVLAIQKAIQSRVNEGDSFMVSCLPIIIQTTPTLQIILQTFGMSRSWLILQLLINF